MPYLHNRIGPWPIVDIGTGIDTRSDVVAYGLKYSYLDVMLSTANLGTASEAFFRGYWDGNAGAGFGWSTNDSVVSVGVALQKLENIPIIQDDSNPTVFIDYSISAIGQYDDYIGKDTKIVPFVGTLDGTSPSDGFSATTENRVTKWVNIPDGASANDETLSTHGHVLLRDIVSGDIPTDQMIVVGFNMFGLTTITMTDLMFNISARYAFDIIKTVDRIHS